MGNLIFDDEFFAKLNLLKLTTTVRLSKGMDGKRKSSAKGSSVEFSDFREYLQGDDIRRIDWNVYGRTNKLYIKQFTEEQEGRFHIFLDTSGSMEFGTYKKSRTALQIAGALSYIVLNNLDRLFVNTIKGQQLSLGTGNTGRMAFSKVLKQLNSLTFDGTTNLNNAIKSRPIHGEGVSILISDFLDPNGIEESIKYLLYKKQQVVLIQVLAQEEVEIDLEGTINLIDMETKDQKKITISKHVVQLYQEGLEKLQNELKRLSKKYNMAYLCAVTNQTIDEILFDENGFAKHLFLTGRG